MSEADPSARPHLYLVDGSSYIFRAYHRLPPLTNRHGQPAGAVYGYTTMLWKLAGDLTRDANGDGGPTHMAVILDASEHTHRNEMYDQYKAHRPPPPEDLVPQFPLIRVATKAFSIPCIEEEGLEADDIIACYVAAAKAAGWRVTIVSSDKDLMQLVEDGHVDMLDTMNDRRIDEAAVLEKFGVGPDKVGDVLALMGDSVDNVPGVPGIGPKTATQLIQQFGDLESVLGATDQITKPKLKQNLVEHAENARLSRELVRLVCDAKLPEPLEDLALKGIPPEPLREFLTDQGFKSLLNRLDSGGSVPAGRSSSGGGFNNTMAAMETPRAPTSEPEKIAVDRSKYETVTDEAALDRWIADARAIGIVAVDTETDHIDSIVARLAGVSLAIAPNKACYIPVGHSGADLYSEAPNQLPMTLVLAKLKPLLEDEAVLKVGHNFKYDWVLFDRAGICAAPVDDTMVMSFDLDAGRSLAGHGLDELARQYFDHECIPYKAVCGTGQKQITFDKVPLPQATEYAAEDADITLRLWHRLKPRLADDNVARVYERVDKPLVSVIGRMERRGVKVDRDYLARLSKEFSDEIIKLEQRIYDAACGPFTIGSPQQLGQVLYERLGLKGGRKGTSGQ
jgi:DNA polymerase-1